MIVQTNFNGPLQENLPFEANSYALPFSSYSSPHKFLPALMCANNDVFGELFVLGLGVKCKFIGRLTVRHLVDLEPLNGRLQNYLAIFGPRVVLTLRNPGMILSTSLISLRFSARGSLTSMAITFQSVSPSSIMANTPSTLVMITFMEHHCNYHYFTLTFKTLPRGWMVDPISQTSIGSLSPLQLVEGSVWLGSSQVCGMAP